MNPYTRTSPVGVNLFKISTGKNCANQASTNARVKFPYNWVFNGEYNPRWREQVQQGIQAGTVASGYKVLTTDPNQSCGSTWISDCVAPANSPDTPGHETLTGGGWIASPLTAGDVLNQSTSPVVSQATRNRALGVFYGKARAAQTDLQGLVSAGELGQTLRMIRSPLKSLRSAISRYLAYLKRGRRRISPRDRENFIRDTWLERSFGWMPLLSDIENGAKALEKVLYADDYPHKRVSGFSAEGQTSPADVTYNFSGPQGVAVQYYMKRTVNSATARYLGLVKVYVPSSEGAGLLLAQRTGLTPSNWLPSLYELIPWSFVVDYFSNLGTVINALAFNNASISWQVLTERQMRTVTYRHMPNKTTWINGTQTKRHAFGDLGEVKLASTVFARNLPQGLGVPKLYFTIPGLSLKWVNLAALASQLRSTRDAMLRI